MLPQQLSDTINSFCESERLSLSQYHVMKREGWGPDEMTNGSRITISPEAKARWRLEREAAARLGLRRALPPDVKRQLHERTANTVTETV